MPVKIHKLEISFDPIEDRLILKFHTEDLSEYRLWLTRRFVKIFWATLKKLLHEDQKPSSQKAQEAEKISQAYEKEQTIKKSEFIQKYSSKVHLSKTPLGPEPILITKIQIKQHKNGTAILCLYPEEGQGFEVPAHSMIINALCKLLSESVRKTDWDFYLEYRGEGDCEKMDQREENIPPDSDFS